MSCATSARCRKPRGWNWPTGRADMCWPIIPPRTGRLCSSVMSRSSPRPHACATIPITERFRAASRRNSQPLPNDAAAMKLVVFGLSVSSSWGNGHAVLWRALICALAADGHWLVFFERDVPWYAHNRDLSEIDGGRLVLYPDWEAVVPEARRELADADAAIVTSYCPDGVAATELVLDAPGLHVFYDLDTPVTLARLRARDALSAVSARLGARRVAPLYGSVDIVRYAPAPALQEARAALSYLGTYAADRQDQVEAFFLEPARRR